jgi:two-component system, OmpR family, response regulator
MRGARIVIVDDERNIREMLALHLRHRGYEVAGAADGAAALALVRDFAPDAIILDVMMPKLDGLDLLPHLRRLTEAPIIMLSAKGDVETRIAGLTRGADDYVPKPFDIEELLVRVEAALRRPSLARVELVRIDDLEVDLLRHAVRRAGHDLSLSALEYKLLVTFLRNRKRVLTREQLLDLAWGHDADVNPSAAERYVSYLRAKIDDGHERKLIRTVRGSGYIFDG